MSMIKPLPALAAAVILLFSSCQKNTDSLTTNLAPGGNGNTGSSSTAQLNTAAFEAAKDYYLWNNLLPSTYDATGFADPAAVMTDIRKYSRETGFTAAVDRWSFAMKKTEWDALSGGMSTVAGTADGAGDLGINVFFRAEGDLRVSLVEPASPAGLAGIQRGWRITAINGNSSMNTTNSNFIVNAVYNSGSGSFKFTKPDGSPVTVTLNAAHYTTKPVYMDTVYSTPAGKVGYLVYNSFLGDQSKISAEYNRVFTKFANAGINHLVVDLRYNGGGYVSLQQQLADYIVSASANGSVMFKQIYNTSHTSENSTVTFHKNGGVNLPKVYFIVGRSTASASELLINNLKPYMDVRLIGAGNTHGKPVGFFPIEDGEWYVFPVSFKTVNKNNEGNYYNGFAPDARVADGLDKNWGDITEASLASALRNITSGSYRGAAEPVYDEPAVLMSGNTALDAPLMKLTIGQ
ncbi:S41 family peptidase [Ferruginibacter sp. HRS2-29]|uniref:S41 family peptidase n=1 Tax=Ferruginibacter sp. HRS2-29 TaxID=2487334 RepID=UPI0020CD9154|nr:S41 family peptidase [Ferruginibacter sp. HRS2-29]MCP9750182.1 hypothetical protein [Ferruginibacter sp. HRS2-29]